MYRDIDSIIDSDEYWEELERRVMEDHGFKGDEIILEDDLQAELLDRRIEDQLDAYFQDDLEAQEKGGLVSITRDKTKKDADPTPPKDGNGNVLTSDEIMEALVNLNDTQMRLSEIVADIEDPEAQAKQAKKLAERWKNKEKDLDSKFDQALKWERHELDQSGIKPYGMDTDEGNQAITQLVDEEIRQYTETIDNLKDEMAKRIRERLDEIGGDANTVAVRDNIYDALIEGEVIESWEPLEF